ncbi:zinc-binding alcohol dehydrogenase [Streptomyces sp. NPDC007355]|uniref:zinc-dependent alcohol dehydrogenase n=1 Tax=Streptomyces sp. NPDC007355 TaxID=3364778 RepID=UPI00369DC033
MERVVQFTGPRQVEVVSYVPAALPSGHVRVRTVYSGISAGTELTAYRGTNPYLSRAWDPDNRLFRDGDAVAASYPIAGWGYSEVGEVVEIASDVADAPGLPALGDMVWGIWGHRSEGIVPAERLIGHQLPDGVDPMAGSFVRVGAIALNAVLAAEAHLDEQLAIFGQGVIGLLATRLAVLSGAHVIAVDAIDSRLKEAVRHGASHVINARTERPAERIRTLTAGAGADTAIEIAGAYRALHEAVRSVGVGGRVVASGFYQGEGRELRLGDEFHHNRVEIVSSQIGGVPQRLAGRWSVDRLQRSFLSLVAQGSVEPALLVSDSVPVSQAAEAYQLLDTRPGEVLQIVLEF